MSEKQKKRLDLLMTMQAKRYLYAPDDIHEHSYESQVIGEYIRSVCRLCGYVNVIPVLGEIGGDDAHITWYKE